MTPLPPSPNRYLGRHFALRGLRERPLDFIMEMAAQFGDLVYFGSLRTPLCFVNHPNLIREVLVSRSHEFIRADAVRNALRIFDGESLLVREGDQWRQQRHLLQHGFRSERLRGYAKKAVAETHEMLLDWPRDGAINVAEETAQLSLRILSDILLGIQLPAAVADSIRMILDVRAIETGKAVATGHRPMVAIHRKKNRALTHVHRFLSELIERRRGEIEDGGDLLTMLVRVSQHEVEDGKSRLLVDRQIRDETISMINASLDATAAGLSRTLLLVAKSATVQTRLRQESERAAGGRVGLVGEGAELPFAEMVVHESLRLYPPNWVLIMRRSIQGTTLGGYRIPRGTWLYIFPYVVHRDRRWFAEPHAFTPDRFASDAFGPLQRSAYMPLGLGPHVCIGKALSTIVLTSILACILNDFGLRIPADQTAVEPTVRIVMRPSASLRLLTTRHRNSQSHPRVT